MPSEESTPNESSHYNISLDNLSDQQIDFIKSISQGKVDEATRNALFSALGGDAAREKTKKERAKLKRRAWPYYKEEYASELKMIMDVMEREKKTKHLYQKDYPQYTLDTLYTRVHQALMYMVDYDIEPFRYTNIRKQVEAQKDFERKRVSFKWIGISDNVKLVLHDDITESTYAQVVEAVEYFIEKANTGHKLEIPNKEFLPFVLNEEQVKELNALCEPCRGLGLNYNVDKDKIFLAKVRMKGENEV